MWSRPCQPANPCCVSRPVPPLSKKKNESRESHVWPTSANVALLENQGTCMLYVHHQRELAPILSAYVHRVLFLILPTLPLSLPTQDPCQ